MIMISWIRGEVIDTEASNSNSAILEGLHKPRPPNQTGRENNSLSKSLTVLLVIEQEYAGPSLTKARPPFNFMQPTLKDPAAG